MGIWGLLMDMFREVYGAPKKPEYGCIYITPLTPRWGESRGICFNEIWHDNKQFHMVVKDAMEFDDLICDKCGAEVKVFLFKPMFPDGGSDGIIKKY